MLADRGEHGVTHFRYQTQKSPHLNQEMWASSGFQPLLRLYRLNHALITRLRGLDVVRHPFLLFISQ
jgi:hypothetical protein